LAAGERASLVIAGAVVGVLGVLLTLFGVIDKLDGRYLPRKEYESTLASINVQLADIKSELVARRYPAVKP